MSIYHRYNSKSATLYRDRILTLAVSLQEILIVNYSDIELNFRKEKSGTSTRPVHVSKSRHRHQVVAVEAQWAHRKATRPCRAIRMRLHRINSKTCKMKWIRESLKTSVTTISTLFKPRMRQGQIIWSPARADVMLVSVTLQWIRRHAVNRKFLIPHCLHSRPAGRCCRSVLVKLRKMLWNMDRMHRRKWVNRIIT